MADEEKQIGLAGSIRKKTQADAMQPEPSDSGGKDIGITNMELLVSKARSIAGNLLKDFSSLLTEEECNALRKNSEAMVENVNIPLSNRDKSILLGLVRDEVFGYGPFSPLLRDPSVEAIYINRSENVYVKRQGKIFEIDNNFVDEKHLLENIDKILQPLGIKLDESNPTATARLNNGSIMEVVIPPVGVDGISLTLELFNCNFTSIKLMVEYGVLSQKMACFLRSYIKEKKNIVISGPRNSGKKKLINALSLCADDSERTISVESSAELRLFKSNWLRLLLDSNNLNLTISDLIDKACRMLPDRLIVGECTGSEVYNLVNELSLGNTCGITTIQASSVNDCLNRLTMMAQSGKPEYKENYLKDMISKGIDVIVQINNFGKHGYRITEIAEISGYDISTLFKLDEEKAKIGEFIWQEITTDSNLLNEIDYDSELPDSPRF